jgi:hypothetical protein
MIRMEDASWGIRIEMSGPPSRQELSKLLDDLRKTLPSARAFFGVILDMSAVPGPINPELRDLLLHAERLLQTRGMVRLAACMSNGLAASQIRRLTSESGVGPGLRCIDSRTQGWQRAAEHWAVSGHEPEDFLSGPPSTTN